MTKLSALYLSDNKIAELAPLAGLSGLSSLDLAKNQITDIKPLGGHGPLLGAEAERQRDRRHHAGHAAPAAEHAARRAQQDRRPRAAGGRRQGRRRRQENFAPFLRLYLAGNPLSDAAKNEQLAALKTAGVRIEN